MRKNVRDYEYTPYDPYDICVRSRGDNITTGGKYMMREDGYGAMNSYVQNNYTSTIWEVIKKAFAILSGIIGFAMAAVALYGLWIIGDAIHVTNWGGEIKFLTYPISVNAAYLIGGVCWFLGAGLTCLFGHIAGNLWD